MNAHIFFVILSFLFIACSEENPSDVFVNSANGESSSSFIAELSSSDIANSSSSEDLAISSSSFDAISNTTETSSSNWPQYSYGELIDERDGHVYKTVKIGNQTWMAENLNYAYTEPVKMADKTIDSASFCYNNDLDSCAKYGRLYVWEAAVDCSNENINSRMRDENFKSRGICPEKWHVPSINEWETLIINEANISAADLKSKNGWFNGGNGSDTFGFNLLPAGLYDIIHSGKTHSRYDPWDGAEEWDPAESVGKYTCFGTHTPWTLSLSSYHQCNLFEGYNAVCFSSKDFYTLYPEEMENFFAFSVRCVKDSTESE